MIHFPARAWNLHVSLTRFFHLIFFFYFLHAFPREAFQHVGSSRKSTCFSLGSFPAHQQTSQIYMLFPEPFAIFSFISEYPHAFTKHYFHQMRKYLNSHAFLARFFHLIFFFYFLHAFPREAFHHVGSSLKSTCFSREAFHHIGGSRRTTCFLPGSFPSCRQQPQIYMLFPGKLSSTSADISNLHAFPEYNFHQIGNSRKSTCFSLGSFPAHKQQPQIYMLFPEPFAIFSFISEYPHAFTKHYFHQMRKYLNSHAFLARFFHLIFFFYFLHAFPREAFHHVGSSLKSTCFSSGRFPSHKQTSQIYMLFPGKLSSMSASAVNLHAFSREAFHHISNSLKSTCFSRIQFPSHWRQP